MCKDSLVCAKMEDLRKIVFLVFVCASFTVQAVELNDISSQKSPTPIVLWHGMGDTCCFSGSMGHVKKFLEEHIPGVYVHSLMLGKNEKDDFANSYFMDVNSQVAQACDMIANDDQLKQGYHAVGFSQGGQFLRAIAQRCPIPPMNSLVTFGAQHQGVYGFPRCPGENQTLCNLARELLNYGAYTGFVQKHLVQAQYWNDPLNQKEYREKSLFLADINNEREPRKNNYKENLTKLKNFVMIKFMQDSMVDPRESETFGTYVEGQAIKVLPMNQTKLYQEDWIGLKVLDQSNRIKIYEVPGDHLQINMDWFANEIIPKYLL